MKRFTISIDGERHRLLKIEAAQLACSIRDAVGEAIDNWLDSPPKKVAPAMNRAASKRRKEAQP